MSEGNSSGDRITVVCTANICRSPMAASLLRHALDAEAEPLRNLQVASAGVSVHEGQPASENSIRALKNVGIDLEDHRSQVLTAEGIERSRLLLCMTESHRALIDLLYPQRQAPLKLFRELMDNPQPPEIPDPFGGPLNEYEACRDAMVEAIPSILEFLRKDVGANGAP
ncbi:MAG: low molecular weight protein arginine phosphatase [Opitutales bacterium]